MDAGMVIGAIAGEGTGTGAGAGTGVKFQQVKAG